MTIETYFNIHDQVFFMKNNKIESGTVYNIQISVVSTLPISIYKNYYLSQNGKPLEESFTGNNLFASKELLRQSL